MRSFCIMSMILFVKCLFCIETQNSGLGSAWPFLRNGILCIAFKWAIILSVFVLVGDFFVFSLFFISSNKNSTESKTVFFFFFFLFILCVFNSCCCSLPDFTLIYYYVVPYTPRYSFRFDHICRFVQFISIFHFLFSFRHISLFLQIEHLFDYFFSFCLVVKMKWFDFGIVFLFSYSN